MAGTGARASLPDLKGEPNVGAVLAWALRYLGTLCLEGGSIGPWGPAPQAQAHAAPLSTSILLGFLCEDPRGTPFRSGQAVEPAWAPVPLGHHSLGPLRGLHTLAGEPRGNDCGVQGVDPDSAFPLATRTQTGTKQSLAGCGDPGVARPLGPVVLGEVSLPCAPPGKPSQYDNSVLPVTRGLSEPHPASPRGWLTGLLVSPHPRLSGLKARVWCVDLPSYGASRRVALAGVTAPEGVDAPGGAVSKRAIDVGLTGKHVTQWGPRVTQPPPQSALLLVFGRALGLLLLHLWWVGHLTR